MQRRIANYKAALSPILTTDRDNTSIPYDENDERKNSWTMKNRFRKIVKAQVLRKSGAFNFRHSQQVDDTCNNEGDGDFISECCDSSSTSSCDTPDTPTDGLQRRVRFQTKNIMTKAEGHGTSPLKLTDEEVESLWWTRQERRDMKRRTQTLAASFLSSKTDYRAAVEQLLLKCVDENGQKVHYADPKEDRVDPFSYEDAVRIAVHHEARGLEQCMVNSLNLQSCRFYYRCGQTSVSTVLKAQAALRELDGVTPDGQATLIAMNLCQCSGFAVRFAQILAEGDAKVVNGDYDEFSSASSSSQCSDDDAYVELDEQPDDADFLLNELCQL
jgi:hypothetical protein